MSRATSSRETGHRTTIRWLESILCPAGSGLRLIEGPSRGELVVREWTAISSAGHPRLLAPLRGRPSVEAFLQFNDSMSQAARLKKWAAGHVLWAAGKAFAPGTRIAMVGEPKQGDLDLFGQVLPDLIGEEQIVVAMMLGSKLRPNTKPVMQIFRPDGRLLAYAKLGWNDLTRSLVDNEAAALRSFADHPPTTFVVPRSVSHIEWQGVSILLVTPLPQALLRRPGRTAHPSSSVVREVAEHGGITEEPLGSSIYIDDLRARIPAVPEAALEGLLSAFDRIVQRHGGVPVEFGTTHGDWAPWNMSTVGSRLHVWDWERMKHGVPIGFDVVHFRFQTLSLTKERSVRSAATETLSGVRSELLAAGVRAGSHEFLLRLYLMEITLRLAAGRAMGVPIHDRMLHGLISFLEEDA